MGAALIWEETELEHCQGEVCRGGTGGGLQEGTGKLPAPALRGPSQRRDMALTSGSSLLGKGDIVLALIRSSVK